MADVNNIQEEQEQEQAEQSSSTLQKLLAPLQNLSRSPLVQRLKHNKNAWYGIAAGLALLVILLLIIAVMPSKTRKQEATQESVLNEVSQEDIKKLLSATIPETEKKKRRILAWIISSSKAMCFITKATAKKPIRYLAK